MKLTTKGKFAVTAILDIAMNKLESEEPITLNHISKRQGISLSYLEQLFVKLRRSGVVKSYKGPGGGYTLVKSMDQISVSEIIKAVDDDLDARSCHGMKNCRGKNQCLTHDLWNNLTHHVYDYLGKITIHDLVMRNSKNKQEIMNEVTFIHR